MFYLNKPKQILCDSILNSVRRERKTKTENLLMTSARLSVESKFVYSVVIIIIFCIFLFIAILVAGLSDPGKYDFNIFRTCVKVGM